MKPKEEPPQIKLLKIFYYVDGVLYFNKSTNNEMSEMLHGKFKYNNKVIL